MRKDFFVCKKYELKQILDRENKRHKVPPRVYCMGYTLETVYWNVYDDVEDYYDSNLEHDFSSACRYCVVYSKESKEEIQRKFFDYLVIEAIRSNDYEEIVIGGDEYYIDVYYNDDELYSMYDFRGGEELSREEIECLNGLAS